MCVELLGYLLDFLSSFCINFENWKTQYGKSSKCFTNYAQDDKTFHYFQIVPILEKIFSFSFLSRSSRGIGM